MSVVIRLMRAGAKKRPFYRVVVADSRRQRDGRFVEILGFYDPMKTPADLKLDGDLVQKWLAQGAQPSTQVASLIRRAGIAAPKAAARSKPAAEGAAKKKAVRRKPRKVSARKAKKRTTKKAAAKSKAKSPKKS